MWGAALSALGGAGGGGGAGMNASSSADMGADYSRTTQGGVTFGKSSDADDIAKWVVVAVGLIAAAKIVGGK